MILLLCVVLCLLRYLDCVIILIKFFSLEKKKFSIHWLYLWIKVVLNFWDCVIDLRGSLIGYFLFTKKRLIYKNQVTDKLHKIKSISLLVSKELFPLI